MRRCQLIGRNVRLRGAYGNLVIGIGQLDRQMRLRNVERLMIDDSTMIAITLENISNRWRKASLSESLIGARLELNTARSIYIRYIFDKSMRL